MNIYELLNNFFEEDKIRVITDEANRNQKSLIISTKHEPKRTK
ncbi:hypothetical protein [Petrotoga sp. 9PW.55.5.1]|nr:hypothetical protein [Petrotoga sp. 9PW.55.5.1]